MWVSLRYFYCAQVGGALLGRRPFGLGTCCLFKLACPLHELVKHLIFQNCVVEEFQIVEIYETLKAETDGQYLPFTDVFFVEPFE